VGIGQDHSAGKDRLSQDSRPRLDPSSWVVQLLSGFFVLALALWVVFKNLTLISEVMAMLFGAMLLALGLEPLVSRMVRRGIPRTVSVLLIYFLLIGVLIGTVGLLLPLFRAELSTLQSQGPALWNSISSTLSSTPVIGRLLPSPGDAANALSQRIDTLLQGVIGALGSIGNAGLDIAVVFLLAYFLVVSKEDFRVEFAKWIPSTWHADIHRISARLLDGLGRWVRAQPLVMLYFGVGFSASLALMGVPFAMAIGLIGGILSVVPFLGAFAASFLAVLSALTIKPALALWVLLIFIAWTELEVHLIAPALFGRALKLHPAIVLLAMFVGTKAAGLVGLLFSVPLAVVIVIILDELRSSSNVREPRVEI
jgi:predicted PurR-regulated permease PerM